LWSRIVTAFISLDHENSVQKKKKENTFDCHTALSKADYRRWYAPSSVIGCTRVTKVSAAFAVLELRDERRLEDKAP